MLKWIFWLLLGVNGVVLALGQGWLGNYGAEQHEPGRLKQQLNSGRMTLLTQQQALADPANSISAAAVTAADKVAAPTPAPAAPAKPQIYACTEVGNFVLADARRFEALLEPLDLGDRQSRRNVAGQEISGYNVYIPPQGSKEGADRKANELKQLGVTDYYVVSDNSPLRWGIALGVFKLEAGAQAQLAALNRQGVHSARVGPRYSAGKLLAFQFRDLDAKTRARIERITESFDDQDLRSCK